MNRLLGARAEYGSFGNGVRKGWRGSAIASFIPLGLSLGILGFGVAAVLPNSAQAEQLEQQLDIQPFNGTAREGIRQYRDAADQLVWLGEQQAVQENYQQAIGFWNQALELYRAIDDTAAMGLTYDHLGRAYGRLRQYRVAEDLLRRRLAIARDNHDSTGQIYGLNNVGGVLLQKPDLRGAQASFEQALAIARNVRDPDGAGLSLSNLGLVAAARSDYQRAIQLYEQAVDLRHRGRDWVGAANTHNNLGDAAYATRNYFRAATAYRAAWNLGRQYRDRNVQIRALDGLIATYQAYQPQAVPQFLAARAELTQDGVDLAQTLETLRLVAEFYEYQGDLSTARQLYQRGLAIAEQIDNRQMMAELQYRILSLAAGTPTR